MLNLIEMHRSVFISNSFYKYLIKNNYSLSEMDNSYIDNVYIYLDENFSYKYPNELDKYYDELNIKNLSIETRYSYNIENATNYINNFKNIFLIVSIALFVASIISYLTFIIANISSRNKDILILKSLGCDTFSISSIFTFEALLFSIFLTAIAIIAYGLIIHYFYVYMFSYVVNFNFFLPKMYISILSVLAIFIVMTILCSLFVFYGKYNKKTIKE